MHLKVGRIFLFKTDFTANENINHNLNGGENVSNVQIAKQQAIREAWMLYFNQVLRSQGLISETDYRRMAVLIRKETADVDRKRSRE